jgi:hypothetical protein
MQTNLSIRPRGKISPFWIAAAFIPWLFLLYLLVANYAVKLSERDTAIIGNFIEWFGTAYSLFLAIVLGYVWTQFDNLDREFDLEVDAIASLHQTSSYISTTLKCLPLEQLALTEERKEVIRGYINDIEKRIVDYVKHVILNYEYEYKDTKLKQKGEDFLEEIGRKISLLTYERSIPDPLVSELFQKLNEAIDVRGDRIAHSKQRMPSAVFLVALVSSFIWLLPFLALMIDNDIVFSVLVGGAAFVIVMVLTIVEDLDDPFDGVWKVNIDTWYEFFETLEHKSIIFVYNIENTGYERAIKTNLGKPLRRPVCNLRYLTYTWMAKKQEWSQLRFGMLDQADILAKEMLAKDYKEESRYSRLQITDFPVIIYHAPNKLEVLLNSQEICSCTNLKKLNETITEKLVGLGIDYKVK